MQIEINQLPTQAQRWFDMAQAGEQVRFVDSGRIVARLALTDISETTAKTTPRQQLAINHTNNQRVNQTDNQRKKKRQAGRLAKIGRTLDPAFFEPLDDEELSLW